MFYSLYMDEEIQLPDQAAEASQLQPPVSPPLSSASPPSSSSPPPPPSPIEPAVQPPGEKKKRILKRLLFILPILALLIFGGLFVKGTFKLRSPYFLSESEEEMKAQITRFVETKQGEPTETISPETKAITTDRQLPKDKYLKDTDNDGFPDFLEEGTGYDLKVVDCAREANCQATIGVNPKSENNVLFILDSSGSMAGQVSGQPKMQTAKKAVSSYIDKVPQSVNAGLMVYGHKGSNATKDKGVSCSGIETLYPLGKIDKEAFKAKVASFAPTGWTPIADSLQKAEKEVFTQKEKDNNSIVLVSDGIETCDGDPCGEARRLRSLGISPIIDVIGFDVDEEARTQLQCIARVTNGKYYDARTEEEFNQAFEQLKKKAEEFEKVALCLNKNFESFMSCMNKQIMASIEYLDREKIAALDAQDQERVEELDKIAHYLDQKYEEFFRGFEKEYTSGIEGLIKDYKDDFSDDSDNPEELEKEYEKEYQIYEKLAPQ